MKSYDGEFRELREFLGPSTEAEPAPPAESAPPPAQVGKYRLLREIGRGGMAIVYEAEDTELHRRVALKVLREPQADPGMIRRMQREAVIAAGLKHPHIVPIHDVGMSGDAYYIAMDLVEGGTLAGRMAEGRPVPELLRWLEETARAAAHAHSQGVVHRDLKPSNVLVDREGQALLTDFGLARAESFASQLTRSSEMLGTPRYMAPEVVAGKAKWVDGRTDVYAMGVILYEMLACRPPHSATTPARLYEQILTDDPQRPSRIRRSVDPALEAICMKAMEKNRAHRYASAAAFADDLRNYLAGEPIRARRIPSWHRLARKAMRSRALRIGGVVVLALLVVAGGAFSWALVKKQRLDRRHHESLRRLGTMWSTIIERKNELRQGKIDPERGRRELAAVVQSIDDHIRDWPNEPQGYYVRARGKTYLDDFEGARRDLDAALAENPDFRPGWFLLAVLKMSEYRAKSSAPPRLRERRIAEMEHLAREASEAFRRAGDPESLRGDFERWSLMWTREDWVMRQLGRIALLRVEEKLDEAARLLAESWKEFESEEFIYWICVNLINGGDRDKLDYWTRRFVASAPGYADAYEFRGHAQLEKQNYKAAIESFDIAIRIRSDHADLYSARGQSKWGVGDLDGARADYDRALSLQPDRPEFYNNRSCVHLRNRKYREALEDADRALALDPENVVAYCNRASAKSELGRHVEALQDCERALALQEDSSHAYLQRGRIKKELGDLAGSIADHTRALELNPEYADAYFNRGLARLAQREFDKAVEDFSRAIDHGKDDAVAYRNRGVARLEKQDIEGAIADFTQAIRIDGTIASSWSNRGAARMEKEDLVGAMADFDRALELDPNDAQSYFNRGNARRLRRDYEGAISDLDRAIVLRGDDAVAYFWRAEMKASLGRFDEAIADYDHGIAIKGDDHDAFHYRGKAKQKKGDFPGAVADYDRAFELDKKCPYVLYDRAVAKRDLGDRSGAIEDLRRALQFTDWTSRPDAERMIAELEK